MLKIAIETYQAGIGSHENVNGSHLRPFTIGTKQSFTRGDWFHFLIELSKLDNRILNIYNHVMYYFCFKWFRHIKGHLSTLEWLLTRKF